MVFRRDAKEKVQAAVKVDVMEDVILAVIMAVVVAVMAGSPEVADRMIAPVDEEEEMITRVS